MPRVGPGPCGKSGNECKCTRQQRAEFRRIMKLKKKHYDADMKMLNEDKKLMKKVKSRKGKAVMKAHIAQGQPIK